jgi:hypothetical protein
MNKRCFRLVLASGFIVLLSGFQVSCDTVSLRFTGPLPAVNESPAGIYFGQFTTTIGANPVSIDVTGIVSEQGQIQLLLPIDTQRHYAGEIQADGAALTGTLTEYRGSLGRFMGISALESAMLSGTVSTADSLSGTYSSALDEGRFLMEYLPSYETGSSLDLMVGVWTFDMAAAGGAAYNVTWDIEANGAIFGTDTSGCVFSGNVSLIDNRYNAYRISVGVTSCGVLDGQFGGLAYLSAGLGPDLNRMTVGISNPVYAFATILQK